MAEQVKSHQSCADDRVGQLLNLSFLQNSWKMKDLLLQMQNELEIKNKTIIDLTIQLKETNNQLVSLQLSCPVQWRTEMLTAFRAIDEGACDHILFATCEQKTNEMQAVATNKVWGGFAD